ncbi:MAG: GNAT family N-acetyltransferase [Vicinamibacterales bacterium]
MRADPRRLAIVAAVDADQIDAVRTLILEYQASLGVDLGFQQFDDEIAALATMYGPPDGALFLATLDDAPAGCVGVRRFEPGCCEMKRLYVRPSARRLHLGQRLADRAIEAARGLGYHRMRLDTLPSMRQAQEMYVAMGFREIPPYRHSPVPGTRCLEIQL